MTNITMNKKQKKGISVVLTTLIIVVASVVLGTAVTLFGTSLFQTGAQQQGMPLTNTHLWQGNNSTAPSTGLDTVLGAIVVRNSGDKIIAVDTIKARGVEVPFGNWYAAPQSDYISADVPQKQFTYADVLTGRQNLDGIAGNELTTGLVKGTGPVSLEPGKSAIIFFIMPNSNSSTADPVITAADVGAGATLNVYAGQISQVQTVSVAKI